MRRILIAACLLGLSAVLTLSGPAAANSVPVMAGRPGA